jgi:hypothetical protein
MRNSLSFVFILSCFLISCSNPKEALIQDFNQCLRFTVNSQYDSLTLVLNSQSQAFVNAITSNELQNYQSYYKLGKDNGLEFFATDYAAKALNEQNGQSRVDLFYQLLAELDISFFSYDKKYIVSKEKSRLGPEPHVAIFHNSSGQKKLTWVKMDDDDNTYKLDLLFLLSIYEASQTAKFKADLKQLNTKALMDYHYTRFLRKLDFIHDVEFHKNGAYNRKALYK